MKLPSLQMDAWDISQNTATASSKEDYDYNK